MKDANLSISDAIRFLVVGIQPFVIFGIHNNLISIEDSDLGLDSLSVVLMLTLSFASGLVIYSIYKPILSDYVISFLQDLFRYLWLWIFPEFHNHRTFIKNEYGISKFRVRKPQLFWFYVSPYLDEADNRITYLIKQSSIIHLLYQTSLICFLAIWILSGNSSTLVDWLWYIGISSILMGLIYDGFIESFIYRLLRGMDNIKRDDCANEFGL